MNLTFGSLAFFFLSANEGERAENEDPNTAGTIQKQSYKMDTHTCHELKKQKDLPEDAEKEQRSLTNIKEAHWENPWKNPVKTRTR